MRYTGLGVPGRYLYSDWQWSDVAWSLDGVRYSWPAIKVVPFSSGRRFSLFLRKLFFFLSFVISRPPFLFTFLRPNDVLYYHNTSITITTIINNNHNLLSLPLLFFIIRQRPGSWRVPVENSSLIPTEFTDTYDARTCI